MVRLLWLLDRLTHRVHVEEMNGDSYRLMGGRKREKKGGESTEEEQQEYGKIVMLPLIFYFLFC